jgi:hypothetical protein
VALGTSRPKAVARTAISTAALDGEGVARLAAYIRLTTSFIMIS